MEDNLENSPEVMHQTPERTESKTPERTTETNKNSSERTESKTPETTNSIKFPEKTSETNKNSQETNSETTKNSPQISTKNSPENIPEKTKSETTKNTPEKTTSNNFLQNLSETTKKTHPDEDVDPFKLFNIPKQNIHVTPEIVPPAAEAVIRHLKPPEPIVLTELIEPDVEKMNQIEEERRKFEEERRKFEEERRKFEEERRRSFIGRKSPRAQFVNSSTPSPDTTQHPSFGGKGVYGRKSPGNKRPMFTISVSSSSASSSSSESEDEIETKSPQITPKTTINICSSTSDEEELSNSLKEINIKSKEQMYKEQQEKRMAKMEATMQLILEKLDKKERKGIYEENKELVEEARTKKEIVQQVKEGGDQEKLEEIAQKTIPRTSREPGNKDSTSSFTNNLS